MHRRSRKIETVPTERPQKQLKQKPEKEAEPILKAANTGKPKIKKSSPTKQEKQDKILQEPKKHLKSPKVSEKKRKSEKVISKASEKIQPQIKTNLKSEMKPSSEKPIEEKTPVKEKPKVLPKRSHVPIEKSNKSFKAIPIKSPKKVEKNRKKKKPKRYVTTQLTAQTTPAPSMHRCFFSLHFTSWTTPMLTPYFIHSHRHDVHSNNQLSSPFIPVPVYC